jgi:hypothetical protein
MFDIALLSTSSIGSVICFFSVRYNEKLELSSSTPGQGTHFYIVNHLLRFIRTALVCDESDFLFEKIEFFFVCPICSVQQTLCNTHH